MNRYTPFPSPFSATRRRGLTPLLLALLLAQSATAWAQGLTPEQVVSLETVSAVSLAPDGSRVAFIKSIPRTADDPRGGAWSELWLQPATGGEPRRLTGRPHSVASPSWTADGSSLLMLSRRTETDPNTQVYLQPIDGGAARQLTRAPAGVSGYALSPDGSRLAFLAPDPVSEQTLRDRQAGRDWTVHGEDLRLTRLWIQPLSGGPPLQVSQEEVNVWDFTWSPDGRTLAAQVSDRPDVDSSFMFRRLVAYPVAGGTGRLLAKTEGKLGPMAYSPDGRRLAWLGAVDMSDPLAQSVFIAPAGGGTPVNLTGGWEASGVGLSWASDDALLVLAQEDTHTSLVRLGVPAGHRQVIAGRGPVLNAISPRPATGRFAAVAHTPSHPAEVYLGSLTDGTLTRLSRHNGWLDRVSLARQETIVWTAPDGWSIRGVLTYPLNYRPGTRYPLILQLHGGPEGIDLDGWTTRALYPVQVLAAAGYAVLQPNYRGSAGRGVSFTKGNHNDLAGTEFEDVLSGIDHLVRMGLVDADRVGTGGFSYGGYFSAWAGTRHTTRFRAAVMGAGISSWISFTGTTDIPYEMSLVHWNEWWWDRPTFHWERSPLAHINQAATPMLIVHGLLDERVHPSQSLEMHTALRLKGVPTRLVWYPRQPHGFFERAHQLDYMARLIEWFDTYVKP